MNYSLIILASDVPRFLIIHTASVTLAKAVILAKAVTPA